ncbi:MAG: FeoB-associated Cys-rich membrane protein [Desulfobacteraceae bacterium]
MDMIIVCAVVAGALFFILRRFIKIYRGETGCQCASSSSCPSKTTCCSGKSGFLE